MTRPKVSREGGDTTTVEGALELLRQNGGRITSSRRFLLRLLFESEGHHTAEELAAEVQAQAPDIHLSTIYRNLDELEKLGVIVLMLVVGMVVDLRTMRVLMIVRCRVFVCCVHFLSFLASLFGIASSSDQARHKTDQRGPLPSSVT